MSNLGSYQRFTTVAKKFGGVEQFLGLIVTGSTAMGAALGIFAKQAADNAKKRKALKKVATNESEILYKVFARGVSNEGLKLDIGDEFRVLATDKDAILIEIIGDANNPYFVDKKLLTKLSDYK